jgi:hypothetical protein
MEALFDMKSFFFMNEEEKVIILNQIIDEELSKPTETIDCDLIKECVDFIGEITENSIQLSKEEKQTIYQNICEKSSHHIENDGGNEAPTEATKRRMNIKKFFLVAAIIVILSSLTVVIVGANKPNVFHNPKLFGISFKDLFKHKVYKEGNITYINQTEDEVNYYS